MLAGTQEKEFLQTATNPGSLKTLRLNKIAEKFARTQFK